MAGLPLIHALLAISIATLSSAASTNRATPLVFGGAEHWYLLDTQTETLQPLTTDFGGLVPIDLSVGRGGKPLVFTAQDKKSGTALLFRWDSTAKKAISIGETRGYHSQPVITDDGNWVYFSHSQGTGGGAPGEHAPQAYAQLYRVRIDGSQLEALSREDGCHYNAHSAGPNRVAVVHSDCKAREELQFYGAKGRSIQRIPGFPARFKEVAIAPDGRTTLRVSSSVDSLNIYMSDGIHPAKRVVRARRYGTMTHAGFGKSSETFYFQNGPTLWRMSHGELTKFATLE